MSQHTAKRIVVAAEPILRRRGCERVTVAAIAKAASVAANTVTGGDSGHFSSLAALAEAAGLRVLARVATAYDPLLRQEWTAADFGHALHRCLLAVRDRDTYGLSPFRTWIRETPHYTQFVVRIGRALGLGDVGGARAAGQLVLALNDPAARMDQAAPDETPAQIEGLLGRILEAGWLARRECGRPFPLQVEAPSDQKQRALQLATEYLATQPLNGLEAKAVRLASGLYSDAWHEIFPTREKFVGEVIGWNIDRARRLVLSAIPGGANSRERLAGLVYALTDEAAHGRLVLDPNFVGAAAADQRPELREGFAKLEREIEELLLQGRRDGACTLYPIRAGVRAILAVVAGATFVQPGPSLECYAQAFCFGVRSLAAEPAVAA